MPKGNTTITANAPASYAFVSIGIIANATVAAVAAATAVDVSQTFQQAQACVSMLHTSA